MFYLPGEKLKATHLVKHKIELTSDKIIKVKRFRNPPAVKQEMQNMINDLLDKGVLKHSTSPYSSPSWIIQKKPAADGKPRWRLVTDYRQLNEITVGNSYPIPRATDIIDSVAPARYITCLDMTSGYYQLNIHPDHTKYTAFNGPYGSYEFTRLSMGLKTAPATFQALMDLVFAGLQGDEIHIYLDDICVFASDLETHGKKFRRLLSRLEEANLTLEPRKCQFLQSEASFLGHIVGNGSIRMDLKKLSAVKEFPPKRAKIANKAQKQRTPK